MKKFGIIGGAGPLASALFYQTVIYESYQRGDQPPDIILLNYPFMRGLTLQEKKNHESVVRPQLEKCIHFLKMCAVDKGIVVCNTMHLLFDDPLFLSMPKSVLEEVRGRKILLLASQNTAASSLYYKKGLSLICPEDHKQNVVDGVIDNILIGKVEKKDAQKIAQLIASYAEMIDGVILGCTDLSVLHHHYPITSDKPLYDSVKICAKKFIGTI